MNRAGNQLDENGAWISAYGQDSIHERSQFRQHELRERIADLRGRGAYEGWPNAHRAIFIHIPKTAGSSVAQALFGGSRHVPYFEYERINPRKFKRFFKFSFVRNPWDRLVSTFFFLKNGGMNEMDRRFAAENLAGYDNFAAFVEGWLNEKNIWSWIHFKPQHYYICDANSTRAHGLRRTNRRPLMRIFAIFASVWASTPN